MLLPVFPFTPFPFYPKVFMSYHILHQFDAPWFAEAAQAAEAGAGNLSDSLSGDGARRNHSRPASRRRWLWLMTLMSLLVAASALFLALDARLRADDLQKRLTTLERKK